MCVGLSAKVVSIDKGTALIDASGVKRKVSAELLDDLEPGDYVMVHAGIAIGNTERTISSSRTRNNGSISHICDERL